ncbi:hypothetical protein [Neorhizobium galegae]|uniref:COG: Uncharacterized homolog of phage Mu protein Gp47 n=2 Tax=Neorhizobium galegae TaxID=399 RepID=A0A068SMH4_NEOGA|nr:hypothetical protein [Neorhizobium galegae]CDN47039.1 COG: Uncharacterized homolog of phage Mu protein Gp47 [Neorhizobium galegae bv. orientalis str. HAMBI 540]
MAGPKTLQKLIALYRIKTGETEMDPAKIADFAILNGIKLPTPADPKKLLVQQISQAAREEMRVDRDTGRPYRAYHSLPVQQGGETLFFWIDIEDATRPQMVRSTNRRREHVVGELVQLSFDLDHWAAANPTDKPIEVEYDFALDIEWRKAAGDEAPAAA